MPPRSGTGRSRIYYEKTDDLLTIAEVCAELRIAHSTWRAYTSPKRRQAPARSGRLDSTGQPVWEREVIERYIASHPKISEHIRRKQAQDAVEATNSAAPTVQQ